MQGFIITFIVFVLLSANPASALIFHKKDYKQNFLNNALNAEKRHDNTQAFHSYEKALFYYKKDKKILESYAAFCERNNYYDKAEFLYKKLFVLTKDPKYEFKANLCSIKNGKFEELQLQRILQNKSYGAHQKHEITHSLIFHYSYKNDWKNINKYCAQTPIEDIGQDAIKTCITASEKANNDKATLKYALRAHQLSPKDSELINKIISLGEKTNNFKLQETFIKKLSTLNPKDNGIKYKLAGLYEKQGDWKKAEKLYEALMLSGDKSEHVMSSYNYVLSQGKAKPPIQTAPSKTVQKTYKPKPLSGFKLAEKNFYNSWKLKNYGLAQTYLNEMLKSQPNNPKLLQHKIDLDISQENYQDAILTFNKLHPKIKSAEEAKYLSFLYSKNNNFEKALDIIEKQLEQQHDNKTLINTAIEYSLASKNWDKAIFYSKKLLETEPKSEKLLKNIGDLYALQQNFLEATRYYEKLVNLHPKTEYKMQLANLYMANQEFSQAQELLEPLYLQNPQDNLIRKTYLNSLLAQKKTYDAYQVVRDNQLLNTKEGLAVLGDLNLKNKQYSTAANYYFKALQKDPDDTIVKNNLAQSYRLLGHLDSAESLFREVLAVDSKNTEAKLGLGSIAIDRKQFKKSREIFNSLLRDNPDYRPAKIALAHSYNANNEKLSALEILENIKPDDESNLLKAQIFYDMNMPTDSKETLTNAEGKDAEKLKFQIKKDNAIKIIPTYGFLYQQLADEFRLNYQKYGVQLSQNVNKNSNVFMEYNVICYTSGPKAFLANVVNQFKGGIQGRPNEKWEYRADLGVKAFQYGGGLIETNSWIKHYFNDKFSLKLGFQRNNLEQSYVSAVGQYIDGIFTGRVADNRTYLEYEAQLPHQFYTFGRGVYGVLTAQNLPTNQYFEGLIGLGRLIYNNPKNPWIQRIGFDVVSYNSAYQYNLLNLYSANGTLYGGYFSPSYFNATTGNLKIEGNIKKWNLKYGISGFGGIQDSMSPDRTTPTWGVSPYIAYDLNNHVSINASYNYYNFADVQRHYFMINAVIRGFREHAKN